jgi:hypothetical protein
MSSSEIDIARVFLRKEIAPALSIVRIPDRLVFVEGTRSRTHGSHHRPVDGDAAAGNHANASASAIVRAVVARSCLTNRASRGRCSSGAVAHTVHSPAATRSSCLLSLVDAASHGQPPRRKKKEAWWR